jgi:tRNA (Thr-GGU) A37 N-methylase
VRLLEIDGSCLRIEGVDLLDGTPVLDIKPYVRDFDDRTEVRCGWLDEVRGRETAADDRFEG